LAAVGTRGRAKPFGDLGQQPPHDVSGQRVLALLSGMLFFILRLAGRRPSQRDRSLLEQLREKLLRPLELRAAR
jgi:hypothetical protein